MTPESDDVSLWEQLGIDVNAVAEPLPDDAFARMLEVAVDPATPEADSDLLPSDSPLDPDALAPDALDLDPVDPGGLHGHDPHAADPAHPDLGADLDSGESDVGDSPFDDDGADAFDVGGHDF